MYVDLAIHLFGLPEFELQSYDLTSPGIRDFAADMGQRLGAVADIVEKLLDDGWSVKVVRSNLDRLRIVRRLLDQYEELWRGRIDRMAELLSSDPKETDR